MFPRSNPAINSTGKFLDALSDSPFSKGLCEKALELQREAFDDLNDMVGNVREPTQSESLEEFVSGCISTVAYDISTAAAKLLGINYVYMPGQSIDTKAPLFMCYSFFVAFYIYLHMEDGVQKPNLQKLLVDTANLFVLYHSVEEKCPPIEAAIKIFKDAHQASKNITALSDWMENLMTLSYLYVASWSFKTINKNNLKYDEMFSRLLGSWMKIAEKPDKNNT